MKVVLAEVERDPRERVFAVFPQRLGENVPASPCVEKNFGSSAFVILRRSVHHSQFQPREERVASTVLCMSIPLEGFIASPNDSCDDNPLGDDGGHLRGWFPAGGWGGDHRGVRCGA